MGVVGGRERDKCVDTKVRSKFIDSKLKYTSNIVRCTAWISGFLFLLVFKEKGETTDCLMTKRPSTDSYRHPALVLVQPRSQALSYPRRKRERKEPGNEVGPCLDQTEKKDASAV